MRPPRSPRLFRLHDAKHLVRYFEDAGDLKPLRLWHLPTLGPQDLLVSSRYVNHLFEILFLFFPKKRPFLVRAADGIVFSILRTIQGARRFGEGPHLNVFADALFVRQDRKDFQELWSKGCPVESILEVDTRETPLRLEGRTAILLAANDPFLERPKERVLTAYREAAARLRALGFDDLRLSCPDPWLQGRLLEEEPSLKAIGRMRDQKDLDPKVPCLGSPSTALLETFLAGHPTLLISFYKDKIMERYLSYDSVLEGGSREVTLKTCAGLRRRSFRLQDLPGTLPRRVPPMGRGPFLRNLRWRSLLSETAFLLGLRD